MELRCAGCKRLIGPGSPRWAGNEPEEHWHYGCAQQAGRAAMQPTPAIGRVGTAVQAAIRLPT